MLEHKKIQNLSDYFVELNSRREKGVYFYRINGYSEEVGEFIKKYYDTARRTGVVIEGKIPNPDEGNLAYYNEIMGMDFQMSMDFIHVSLRKWLPRMNEFQRQNVAASIYDSLDSLRKAGKTENMLRNAYIKFMCWLYYKFERIVNQLGENHIPKILYEGQISNYELMLISILSNAGCDVVLLQYAGDQGYLKTDPGSVLSDSLQMEGLQPFPQGYCVKKVRDEIQNELNNERLYGIRPSLTNCTNAWIKGNGLDDIRESILLRGNDSRFFYNCFCRINGAEDKLTYANELFRLQQELRNSKRNTVIVSKEIPRPPPQEISEIKRSNYTSGDQMLLGLACNIQYGANPELQRILHKTFVDVMLAESQKEGENLNRLTNRAVYLLWWMRPWKMATSMLHFITTLRHFMKSWTNLAKCLCRPTSQSSWRIRASTRPSMPRSWAAQLLPPPGCTLPRSLWTPSAPWGSALPRSPCTLVWAPSDLCRRTRSPTIRCTASGTPSARRPPGASARPRPRATGSSLWAPPAAAHWRLPLPSTARSRLAAATPPSSCTRG